MLGKAAVLDPFANEVNAIPNVAARTAKRTKKVLFLKCILILPGLNEIYPNLIKRLVVTVRGNPSGISKTRMESAILRTVPSNWIGDDSFSKRPLPGLVRSLIRVTDGLALSPTISANT